MVDTVHRLAMAAAPTHSLRRSLILGTGALAYATAQNALIPAIGRSTALGGVMAERT
jgi:hypothetical protein